MSAEPRRRRGHHVITFAAGIVALLLAPGVATAQRIGGTVTDATGAVLPGVTVEARSPALIEQVRSVVTDGGGQYLIVALEPGMDRRSKTRALSTRDPGADSAPRSSGPDRRFVFWRTTRLGTSCDA